MANKNFTQFELRVPPSTSDFLVGYKADGTAEYRTTIQQIINLVGETDSQILSFNETNGNLTISSGNTVSLSSLSGLNISALVNYLSTNNVSISSLNITNGLTVTGNISGYNLRTSFNQGSATGNWSFAEGSGRAFGEYSHAEGLNTIASGIYSHTEGSGTVASGDRSHAEGRNTTASGGSSHAEGQGTVASGNFGSHAEGYLTKALSASSHAEGNATTASGDASHAEGESTTASGYFSHAQGKFTIASGIGSHAQGFGSRATGVYSHVEGLSSVARGDTSRAAGYRAEAAQNYTYAWTDGLLGTTTANVSTTRSGQYMVSASGGVFIPGNVGIRTDSIANALTVNGAISSNNIITAFGGNSNLWNTVYTNVQSNSASWASLTNSVGSKTIYVDNSRTDSYTPDGSELKPYSTFRQAFSAIGNAANTTEFNALSSRHWTIKAKAGFYNESAGGDLQVPRRFFVKLDLSDGVSLSGNLVRDIAGLATNTGDHPVLLIEGTSNRPFFEVASPGQTIQVGIVGNISMINTRATNALHLFAAGVRKVEYSGTGGSGHFFANQNSTWDTLFSPTKQVTFYCAGTRNSTGFNSAGNVIGNIYITSVYDTYWISNKSVFPTNEVYFRFDEDVAPPTYIERRATSFTRSSNQATVTLAENHGLSLSPAIVSDGYVPEQYIIINGVSENTSFNTPLYGAKVVSYPTPNTVVYESSGVDVTTPVVALSSKFIRGTFLGNASLVGFNQMGANGRASENAAMTFPNFANAAELGQGSAFLLGFAKGVSFSNPLTSWPASTTLPKNTILILDDQFQYRTTTGVGRTSAVQPTFPTTIGATVQDNFVTWVCEENALDRNLPRKFNVQSKLEQLSNAENIYLKSEDPELSSFRNVKDAIEFVNTNTAVHVTDFTTSRTFLSSDTSRIFHFDTTTQPLCAIFPSTLPNGFNVAIMNTGTNNLRLSAAQLNSVGVTIGVRYGGAFVYKDNNQLFAVGRL